MSRRVTKVQLPHSNAMLSTRSKLINGKGMGSVLLSAGGPGMASSYMDMEDYIHTTGQNPYAGRSKPKTSGTGAKGFGRLNEKLSKLSLDTQPKRKNITMSM